MRFGLLVLQATLIFCKIYYTLNPEVFWSSRNSFFHGDDIPKEEKMRPPLKLKWLVLWKDSLEFVIL